MKKVILSLMIAFAFHFSDAQVIHRSDCDEMNLKGNVKSIRETSYTAVVVGGEIRKAERKRENKEESDTYTIFNYNGNVIEETEFNSDGNAFKKVTYQYDDRENPVEVGWFDIKGRLVLKHRYINKYNGQGNLSERTHVRPDGTIEGKYIHKYDSNGNLIESLWLKNDSTPGNRETFRYNERGKIAETENFSPDGKSDLKIVYKYDEHGSHIGEDNYSGAKFIIGYLRKFDAKGSQIEVEWRNADGKVYDKYKQVFEYDRQGNWTKQIQFRYDNPTYIYERVLVYF